MGWMESLKFFVIGDELAHILMSMKNRIKVIACVAVVLIVGVFAAVWTSGDGVDDRASSRKSRKVRASSVVRTGAKSKKVTEISLDERDGKRSVRIVESDIERPNVADEDDDEAKLTQKQRAALKELQAALDEDDIKAVRRALDKMIAKTSSNGSLEGLPTVMRAHALEALGWFGKSAVADIVPFLADSDSSISKDAFDKFQMAIDECDDDGEKSLIVKTMMQVITDGEQIDTMLNNLNDMRNSVKAETITSILTDGTDKAKQVMMEQLGEYTEDDVSTIDDLKRWIVENPDEDDSDEIYGERRTEAEKNE